MKGPVEELRRTPLDHVVNAAKSSGDWSRESARMLPESETFRSATFQYREFICGWGAAFINITVTFPLNKVMFRQQLYGISSRKALAQLQKEGIVNLYRGLVPPCLQKTTSMAIMFGCYDKYQRVIAEHVDLAPWTNKSIAAMLAGCTEALLCPFERIQVLLQDKYYHSHFRNTAHAFSELRQYGYGEYYRGIVPVLMRNGPSNVLFFLFRTELKKILPQTETAAGHYVVDFISGGVLGAFISTVFFPINVIKVRIQTQLGGPSVSFWEAFRTVYYERNQTISKLFRGVHVNYTRSLISWGLINASYELLKKTLYPEND